MPSRVYPIVLVVAARAKGVALELGTLADGRDFRKVAKVEIDCKAVVGDSHVLVFWIHLEPFCSSVVLLNVRIILFINKNYRIKNTKCPLVSLDASTLSPRLLLLSLFGCVHYFKSD